MRRRAEPELMDDEAQALAYARADFAEPHDRFVALLRARVPALAHGARALDLGCGPGDVTLRVARAFPALAIDGVDGSEPMLRLARAAVAASELAARVRFARALLPDEAPPAKDYALVFSNSLLHHLRDPATLWSAARRFGAPAAPVFVMDLLRPESEDAARALVAREAASEPEILQRDFFLSLCAAYTLAEVAKQLRAAELELTLEPASDRHWIAHGAL